MKKITYYVLAAITLSTILLFSGANAETVNNSIIGKIEFTKNSAANVAIEETIKLHNSLK